MNGLMKTLGQMIAVVKLMERSSVTTKKVLLASLALMLLVFCRATVWDCLNTEPLIVLKDAFCIKFNDCQY